MDDREKRNPFTDSRVTIASTRIIHYLNDSNKINAFIAVKCWATIKKLNKTFCGDTKKNITRLMKPAIP